MVYVEWCPLCDRRPFITALRQQVSVPPNTTRSTVLSGFRYLGEESIMICEFCSGVHDVDIEEHVAVDLYVYDNKVVACCFSCLNNLDIKKRREIHLPNGWEVIETERRWEMEEAEKALIVARKTLPVVEMETVEEKDKNVLHGEMWIAKHSIKKAGCYSIQIWMKAKNNTAGFSFEWRLESKFAGLLEWRKVYKARINTDEGVMSVTHMGYVDENDELIINFNNHGMQFEIIRIVFD